MFSHNMPCFLVNFKLHLDFMYKCFLLNYEEVYMNSKMFQSVMHLSPVQTLWYYKVLSHPLQPVLERTSHYIFYRAVTP